MIWHSVLGLIENASVGNAVREFLPESVLWRSLFAFFALIACLAISTNISWTSVEISHHNISFRAMRLYMWEKLEHRWDVHQTMETWNDDSAATGLEPQEGKVVWRLSDQDPGKIIRYEPTFGNHWFIEGWQLYVYTRVRPSSGFQGPFDADERLVLRCWPSFYTRDVQKIIEHATQVFHSRQEAVTLIYHPTAKPQRLKGAPAWSCVQAGKRSRSIDTVIMDRSTKDEVVRLIEGWSERRQHYSEQMEPYRMGFLFEGPTGTGKTSFAFAIAGKQNRSVYCLPLNTPDITEEDLPYLVASLPGRCILLLEDLDSAGVPSRNPTVGSITLTPTLSLSAILNAVDGVATPEDIIMIGTANDSTNLDPALVRKGRLGNKVQFTLAAKEHMIEMFLKMYEPKRSTGEKSKYDMKGLAIRFASLIPEMRFSAAEIRSFLLTEPDPEKVVDKTEAWLSER